MRRATLLIALMLSACAAEVEAVASNSQALIAGELDSEHPAVVALVTNANAYCTGTLIAERVVLTAAHCVELTRPEAVFFGHSLAQGGKLIPVERARAHPAFVPSGPDEASTNDIAALLLAADAPVAVTPIPVLDPALAAGELTPDRELLVVGFGGVASSPGGAGIKRKGSVAIDSVGDQLLYARASPSHPCGGDSGGPALLAIDGEEYLVGVTAGGDPNCGQYSVHTRADVHVDGFIRHFPEPQGQAGERCYQDGNCVSGLCLPPRSLAAFAYCSTICRDDQDCEQPARCVRDDNGTRVCRLPADEPGALGSRCRIDSDCATQRCDHFEDNSPRTCTLDCDLSDEVACPENFECRPAASSDAHACFRPPLPADAGAAPAIPSNESTIEDRPGLGGCGMARGSARGRWLVLVLLVLCHRYVRSAYRVRTSSSFAAL